MTPAASLHELDSMPLLMSLKQFAQVLGKSADALWRLEKQGRLVKFEASEPVGPARYSRVLIARSLEQQPVYEPTFGRHRRSA